MKPCCARLALILCLAGITSIATAQSAAGTPAPSTSQPSSVVPQLVRISGTLSDLNGKPLTGVQGVTFALYKDQQGGAPLWLETQSVRADSKGHYSVMLGSTTAEGLPADVFSSGDARWLGVQPASQPEQARVMLLSVPYALKAGDAQTLGGLPPSAFMLSVPVDNAQTADAATANSSTPPPPVATDVTTTGGTVNTLSLFSTATNIQNSIVTQTGAGETGKIGINTGAPGATLDVNGTANVRGSLTLPATGTAAAAGGKNSQPQDFIASVFNSTTSTAVPQKFQWQAEPLNNDKSTATGTLNLLYASGSAVPAETGLKISNSGLFTFAKGQTFPGTGTVTDVTAGTGLSGGGSSGAVTLANTGILALTAGTGISLSSGQSPTLSVNKSQVPLLASANTFTGNQTVSGNLSATGLVSSTGFEIGSNLFDFGNYAAGTAYSGFAGNSSTPGIANTGQGVQALLKNSTGTRNTAVGTSALGSNTTGAYNTGLGFTAGYAADGSNVTGEYNTFIGSGTQLSTGSLTNASAIGANSQVSESNALVLGSIPGVNGATASARVGIGTPAPITQLHIAASASGALGPIVTLMNTAGGTGAGGSIDFDGYSNTSVNPPAARFQSVDDGQYSAHLTFSTKTPGAVNYALTERMRLTDTGLLGIGTTTPAALLTVSGSESSANGFGAAIKLANTATGGANYYFRVGATGTNTSAGGLSIANDDEYIMTFTTPGDVGINTQSPDATLSVNGSADKPGGGSWGVFSDQRLKNVNGSFNDGLNAVLKLHPVRYRYKKDNGMGIRDSDEHIGFVAQEVQKVIPEAVTENSRGYLLVNNDPIIWAMLNAIQQQQKQIGARAKQIAAQERQICRDRRVVSAQQHEIARLNHKVTILETTVRDSMGQNSSVLVSSVRAGSSQSR
jgi:Chaperone of endosialidase